MVVQAGDPVRLRIAGAGFAVSAAGQALGTAAEGQPVRVRSELGKILTGVARAGRVVEVAL
jgi:flagella basal body P-ring formation protein FlgA